MTSHSYSWQSTKINHWRFQHAKHWMLCHYGKTFCSFLFLQLWKANHWMYSFAIGWSPRETATNCTLPILDMQISHSFMNVLDSDARSCIIKFANETNLGSLVVTFLDFRMTNWLPDFLHYCSGYISRKNSLDVQWLRISWNFERHHENKTFPKLILN